MNDKRLKRKITTMVVILLLLVCGLTITSFALANSIAQIRENRFEMSEGVELEINGIDVTNIVYEPGGKYESEFTISNIGTLDVWYRVYFTNVTGDLKDVTSVTVKEEDGDKVGVSIRSSESFDAAEICAHFGGGGHARAAGCQFSGKTVEEVSGTVVDYIINEIIK